MAQIFGPSSNIYAKLSIVLGALLALGGVTLVLAFERSPYRTNLDVVYTQPIKFSHDHHVAGLGIDCLYCHYTADRAASANIPPTELCMSCHSQVWADSPMLEPVRASYRNNEPIEWERVYDLPDYVYFDHSIHVAKGVSCYTCHGNVNEQALLKRSVTLQMNWCLDCHRDPAPNLRPPSEVTNFRWEPPEGAGDEYFAHLAAEADVANQQRLWSCSTCHR
ncbi:MAG: cytochrome c family protein [Holophagales bacterium]|nr:cytochrome c family protein [Holophagales bacterium]